jgi:hypothetical protein
MCVHVRRGVPYKQVEAQGQVVTKGAPKQLWVCVTAPEGSPLGHRPDWQPTQPRVTYLLVCVPVVMVRVPLHRQVEARGLCNGGGGAGEEKGRQGLSTAWAKLRGARAVTA